MKVQAEVWVIRTPFCKEFINFAKFYWTRNVLWTAVGIQSETLIKQFLMFLDFFMGFLLQVGIENELMLKDYIKRRK